MSSTYETLHTELLARLGNRTDIGTRGSIWLNDAMYEILMNPKARFHQIEAGSFFTTVATQTGYPIADIVDNFWVLLNAYIPGERQRMHIVHTDVTVNATIQQTSGVPTRISRFGALFLLDPIPDDAYVVEFLYRKRVAALTAGGTSPMPREWDEPLVVLATIKGLEALQRFEEAARYRTMYEGLMSIRLDETEMQDEAQETTIGVRFD